MCAIGASQRRVLVNPAAARLTFLFHLAGRDTAGIDQLGRRVTMDYDAEGRQTLKWAALSRLTYTIDAVGRTTQEKFTSGRYDAIGTAS